MRWLVSKVFFLDKTQVRKDILKEDEILKQDINVNFKNCNSKIYRFYM